MKKFLTALLISSVFVTSAIGAQAIKRPVLVNQTAINNEKRLMADFDKILKSGGLYAMLMVLGTSDSKLTNNLKYVALYKQVDLMYQSMDKIRGVTEKTIS